MDYSLCEFFKYQFKRKLISAKKDTLFILILGIAVLIIGMLPKNYTISIYYLNIMYKYVFFILVIGISFLVLLLSIIKKSLKITMRRWLK